MKSKRTPKLATPSALPPATLFGALVRLDKEALARVWTDCNRWQWPQDLPVKLKPAWWDGHQLLTHLSVQDRKHGYIAPIMEYISAVIPKRKIMETWRERTIAPNGQAH